MSEGNQCKMEGKERKVFNDPIHGTIELHSLCVKIIDTPQFQRLRFIKQLGGAYFVYPGAAHNRFEHSIGVCHLAGRLVRALRDQIVKSKELKDSEAITDIEITPKDELCVEVAALCHDLGHGPFSHLFDGAIIPKFQKDLQKQERWTHEQGSLDMLQYMIDENDGLDQAFKDAGIDDRDRDFIDELIYGPSDEKSTNGSAGPNKKSSLGSRKRKLEDDNGSAGPNKKNGSAGPNKKNGSAGPNKKNGSAGPNKKKWPYEGREEEKGFLYEIVSNKRNGIDVDKWDYFARDCYMLGIGNNFNHDRCISFARVIDVNGERQICYRNKEASNLYDMFHTRYLLHTRAYQHKTNNIIEYMIAEALKLANGFLMYQGKKRNYKMSDTIKDMKAFTLLNDGVIYRIIESESKKRNVVKSKKILERVLSRDLYKFVGEKRFVHKTFEDEEEVKETMDEIDEEVIQNMGIGKRSKEECKNTVIDIVNLNYGKKEKNPMTFVNFYSKQSPNKAEPIKKDDVSLLLSNTFAEQLVRVYCKDKKFYEKVKKRFEAWSEKKPKRLQKKKKKTSN